MKRLGGVFESVIDTGNLRLAFSKAARGKHCRAGVKKIEPNLEDRLAELKETLANGSFKTSEYRTKYVYEPKKRLIYILPFWPDRVVQHAIVNVLEPYWEKLFINDSYSCLKGRGQHKGSERTLQLVRQHRYVYKADIRHFYPSINHGILKGIIRKKIKDGRLLALLDDIIDSVPGETNAPIGNLLSQWFGNLYLNELDMFVKHRLHCRAYVRYCDDFTLYADYEETLREWSGLIEDFLKSELELTLSRSSIFPTAQGVDFLGYRHFPEGYLLVRKSTARRMRRKLKAVRKGIADRTVRPEYAEGLVASVSGWLSWANSYHLRESMGLDELTKEVHAYSELCRPA